MTSSKSHLADNRLKDIAFCADRQEFRLTINAKPSIVIAGNFTFFNDLNVWHFLDKNFTGCLTRVKIGTVFPLKERSKSRLTYQGKIKFDSCPYDKMLRSIKEYSTDKSANISVSTVIESVGKVRLLSPVMCLIVLCCMALSICLLSWYICSRPDGVYETNENLSAFCTPSKSVEPLVVDTFQKEYFC
ncbi:hypothetical protein L596_004296 [Steinernema carpocapsae]|uniref:Laminin G domain-containing protein n=1 Tax=Steinernema carpocapsae TaxID=34508 RepID=A0A4U8UVG9_STECR|nr:hypothetical protein L596_004296 [Steinernema carpocapsae]